MAADETFNKEVYLFPPHPPKRYETWLGEICLVSGLFLLPLASLPLRPYPDHPADEMLPGTMIASHARPPRPCFTTDFHCRMGTVRLLHFLSYSRFILVFVLRLAPRRGSFSAPVCHLVSESPGAFLLDNLFLSPAASPCVVWFATVFAAFPLIVLESFSCQLLKFCLI